MKKELLKIVMFLTVFILTIIYLNDIVCAVSTINPNDYEPDSTTSAFGAEKVKALANSIIFVIRSIGVVISVAVLIVLGIKYMMGSVEEKADYKKTLWPYVIGVLLLLGITNIVLPIIISIAEAL